jgi:hypothetical protein
MPEVLPTRAIINVFLAFGALFALWKGGTAERSTAIVVIVNVLIGQTGHWVTPQHDPVIRLVNDGLAALALLGITLRFGAPWMGGIMLFFAAQFSMHSYYMVLDLPMNRLHAIINNVDWIGIAWCLIIGTAMAWRKRAAAA